MDTLSNLDNQISNTPKTYVKKFFAASNEKKFMAFEILIFCIAGPLIIIIPMLLKGFYFQPDWSNRTEGINGWDILKDLDVLVGFIGAILLAKKHKSTWIWLMIDSVFYGLYSWYLGTYALAVVNVIIFPIIILFQQVFWKKNTNLASSKEVLTRKLNIKEGLFTVMGIIILMFCIAPIVISTDQTSTWLNPLHWIDALMASLGIFAYIIGAMRFRETWYLWWFSNVVKLFTWGIMFGMGNNEYASSLIMATAYFINATTAMVIWQKSKLVSIKEVVNKDIESFENLIHHSDKNDSNVNEESNSKKMKLLNSLTSYDDYQVNNTSKNSKNVISNVVNKKE